MRTVYGPIYTLRPYERGIRETLGKYSGFVMPGLGFQIPFIHLVRVRDVREHTDDRVRRDRRRSRALNGWRRDVEHKLRCDVLRRHRRRGQRLQDRLRQRFPRRRHSIG